MLFHPIQLLAHWMGGYPLRKKVVDVMCCIQVYSLSIVGARFTFKGLSKLPTDRPLIIVANHQTLFDISPIVWAFRRHHPKFVSKKELGKWIPSVSLNLRLGGSVLIDRSNQRQSIVEILKLGKHIEAENYSACIFPEGTRSKNGKVGAFQSAGLAGLMRSAPNALIVPFAIKGNYQFFAKKGFPFALGTKVEFTALAPIEPKGQKPEALTQSIHEKIVAIVENS